MNHYRILKQGEQILPGDEIKNTHQGWSPTSHFEGEPPAIIGVTPWCIEGHYRRRGDYPEHTPPAPPEGMKWEYRGKGWNPMREATYYIEGWISYAVNRIPDGYKEAHYFEAVPDVNHTKFYEKLDQVLADLVENPYDPKGAAGSRKAPLCMLPSFPLHEASWVLKSGADKYGPWNWRENEVCASTYRSAMQRHLDQWFDELEDVDRETNRSHLAHVIANACILMDAAKHGTLVDDRPSMNHDTTI